MSYSQGPDVAMMRYDANKKSAGIAYLLWFFLGSLGIHRFYLGRVGSGIAMLLLTVISFLLLAVGIGLLGLFAAGIWWIVDAFLIPGIVAQWNNALIQQIAPGYAMPGYGHNQAYPPPPGPGAPHPPRR